MNIIESKVIKVLSKPYFNHLWCVDVETDCWGSIQKTTVHCKTEEEANDIKIGFKFDN